MARVFMPPERWVNSIAVYDADARLVYARFDAATPPLWQHEVCYQTDLFLDLLYDAATGNYLVLDEQAFAAETARGTLPPRWAAAAEQVLSSLLAAGDRDALPGMLDAWCPAPVVRTEGLRLRETVEEIEWPEKSW
jgi:hypothetical protein